MPLTPSKAGPYFTSGSISFSELRLRFKETSSGTVKASELLRETNTGVTDPVVPDATENSNIGSSSGNWKPSQFRNSIKYYNLTQDPADVDLNLNLSDDSASGWNGNLGKTIKKKLFLQGTCGSTNGNPAASLGSPASQKAAYNLRVEVAGGVYGSGGVPQGGGGGVALSINTGGAGSVVVYTTGSASVYGGGGGGGRGGTGGKGGNGTYTFTTQQTRQVGGASGGSGGAYWQLCQNVCRNSYGGSATCQSQCYRTFGQGGCGCTCYSNEQAGQANCQCCQAQVNIQNTGYSTGGDGGTGDLGGFGRGYQQAPTGNAPGGPGLPGGQGAGNGGDGGTSGSGGEWGTDGTVGATGNKGQDGNQTQSPDFGQSQGPQLGTDKGFSGAAVGGSGFTVDPTSVLGAFAGSYT